MTYIEKTCNPEESDLGKSVFYSQTYDANLLFPILRESKRHEIGILTKELPFVGFDLWNHYEVSWLNAKGKPIVAIAEISYPCESACIIESKSMKLYFNSFNNTKFSNIEEVTKVIIKDLSERVKSKVQVVIKDLSNIQNLVAYAKMDGVCLDSLDVECSSYTVNKDYLTTLSTPCSETVYSNLLKSNCLITNQPDWASIQITYKGNKIEHLGLLKYLISFRNHNEFHEQCIERIFMDIMQMCKPTELNIIGRYTRRGGLDINVYRCSNKLSNIKNNRLVRQ